MTILTVAAVAVPSDTRNLWACNLYMGSQGYTFSVAREMDLLPSGSIRTEDYFFRSQNVLIKLVLPQAA